MNKSESIEEVVKSKRLRNQPRYLAFRYMRNLIYARRKFMEPCVMPFINREFIEKLWEQPSILMVLDSGRFSNLLLPDDYDTGNSISQIGLNIKLSIALLKLGRFSSIHLKINALCNLTFPEFIKLATFLKNADWISELRINVPSIPNPAIQMLINLTASKITFYHGPSSYIAFLINQPNLKTLVNTAGVRPSLWTRDSTNHQPYCIKNAFKTQAKELRFESGLFERLWTNDPLPLNTTAESIRITDSEMMKKMDTLFDENLPDELVHSCALTFRSLKRAIQSNCNIIFNHRGWCGFPCLQSLDALVYELSILIKRGRHLAEIARDENLAHFRSLIEMDVVLRRNSIPCGIYPEMVLNQLEHQFRCHFSPYNETKNSPNKPPQIFIASLDLQSVVIILDFSYGIHPL